MPLIVGIDVGGTFTDLAALDEDSGTLTRIKVPSVPSAPEQGVMAALDALLAGAQPRDIASVSHSTTIATNALLGQIGLELPRIALFVTEGFRDLIEIGRQNRSDVYNLNVTRPKPLVDRQDRIPVHERMDFRGHAVVPLERLGIEKVLQELRRREGVRCVAVAFLHAYANDAHERALGDALLAAFPEIDVSLSSEVDREYREYERTSTAVVNAALLPLVRRYLRALSQALHERGVGGDVYVMQSSGGVASAEAAAVRPATIIESGPASGVIGAAFLARSLHIDHVLSFDMGGTTAKAGTVIGGMPQLASEFEAAGRTHSGRAVRGSGYPVRFPFIDLAEVSAGGGTIAFVDEGGALRVGPLSAGADPGPAAYGKSMLPTVTDANVVLGRLNPRALLGGSMPIDAERARTAVASLTPGMRGLNIEQTATGIIALADNEMAKILRIVTIERGYDPRDFTLVAFGGGGPLHACALAEELGIVRIIVPPAPGVFSAHGLLVADVMSTFVRSIISENGAPRASDVEHLLLHAESIVAEALERQGVPSSAVTLRREIDARYVGQSYELTLEALEPFDDDAFASFAESFHARHESIYGYASRGERIELVNVRCTATGELPKPRPQPWVESFADVPHGTRTPSRDAVLERREVLFREAARVQCPVYDRARLAPRNTVAGPAIIEEYDSCTLLAPGWFATVDEMLDLVLERP